MLIKLTATTEQGEKDWGGGNPKETTEQVTI